MGSILTALVAELRRRILGISPEEIRYTFEDVRKELRATRAELKDDIAKLREELHERKGGEDVPRGPEIPVAEA